MMKRANRGISRADENPVPLFNMCCALFARAFYRQRKYNAKLRSGITVLYIHKKIINCATLHYLVSSPLTRRHAFHLILHFNTLSSAQRRNQKGSRRRHQINPLRPPLPRCRRSRRGLCSHRRASVRLGESQTADRRGRGLQRSN